MGVDFLTANKQAERQTEEWVDMKNCHFSKLLIPLA
jgi:hypothetical protein